jgi:predicted permease
VGWFERLGQDIRYGVRTLVRAPIFTATALITLAVGIGATAAIFSVARAALLAPLPYPDESRLARVQQSWEGTPAAAISPAEYLDYVEGLEGFSDFGVYVHEGFEVVAEGVPVRVRGTWMSPGALEALGVTPTLGRFFTADEDAREAPVVLISAALWRERFGASPDVLGRTMVLNGRETEIIGVMPSSFRMPELVLSGVSGQVYRPLGITADEISMRGSHFLRGVGRLASGVTMEQGAESVARTAGRMVESFPDDYPSDMRFEATAFPLAEDIRGPVRSPVLALLGAVVLVLLVACANVAGLLVARGEGRRQEFGVRTALGAGRRRLVGQVLVESALLALMGGALGMSLALWATTAVGAFLPPSLAWLSGVRVDGPVLLFALGTTLVTGVVFGLLPAVRSSAGSLVAALHDGGRGTSTAPGRQHLRSLLVVAELATALVLLAGAGVLTRSFLGLVSVDPGFRTDGVTAVRVELPTGRYPADDDQIRFFQSLVPRLETIPGVSSAGGATGLPLTGSLGDLNFRIEGRPIPEGAVSPAADWQVVTPGYLETMRLRLVRGRTIDHRDRAISPGVVVINETLANLHWPGEEAIGRRFELGGGAGPGWVEVVGVVGDVRHGRLDEARRPQMYLAHPQFRFWGGGGTVRWMEMVVASSLPSAELVTQIRAAIGSIDPVLAVGPFRTMDEVRSTAVAVPRLLMLLMGAFSLAAALVAVVGIYGVTAYGVGQRRREFGIRMALGATPGEVRRMVLRQGLRLAGVGILLGLLGTLVSRRLLRGLLYGVGTGDPATLVGAATLLAGAALVASLAPARRATRVQPSESLRAE